MSPRHSLISPTSDNKSAYTSTTNDAKYLGITLDYKLPWEVNVGGKTRTTWTQVYANVLYIFLVYNQSINTMNKAQVQ